MQDYNRLRVFNKAHAFALNARRLSPRWPREYATLRSQLVRAAESVPANIVEGCSRQGPKELAHFLQIAIASCTEAEYHLRLAYDNGLLDARSWQHNATEICDIRRMLCGLIKKIRASLARQATSQN